MKQSFQRTNTANMTTILEGIIEEINGDQISIEQIVDHLKHRGFGPLLAVLSLFVIIVGAIPLVPAFIGLMISFISIQMLIGYEYPWMPQHFKHIKIDKSKIENAINFAKPYTKKLERVLRMRYTFLFNRVSEIITAVTCLILAVLMISIGFIPILPALFSIPIFMFGIGYTLQDGLLIIVGFIIIFGMAWFWFVR